jgi:hypothetical protein
MADGHFASNGKSTHWPLTFRVLPYQRTEESNRRSWRGYLRMRMTACLHESYGHGQHLPHFAWDWQRRALDGPSTHWNGYGSSN